MYLLKGTGEASKHLISLTMDAVKNCDFYIYLYGKGHF